MLNITSRPKIEAPGDDFSTVWWVLVRRYRSSVLVLFRVLIWKFLDEVYIVIV